MQLVGQAIQAATLISIPGEHLGHHSGLGFVLTHAGGIARAIRIDAIAIRHPDPRQQDAGLQLAQPAAPHPLGNQAALVFGHGPTDLQQKLVVGILAHRPVEEVDLASSGRDLLEQQHLMHIVAGEPVGSGDQNAIQLPHGHAVAQPLQPGPLERGATVAVITEDVLGRDGPSLLVCMRLQTLQLLGEAIRLGLALSGHPCIDPDPHPSPPVREARGRPGARRIVVRGGSRPTAADKSDPSAAVRPSGAATRDAPANPASLPPAADMLCDTGQRPSSGWRKRNGNRHQFSLSCPKRLRQNLSFVIRPSQLCCAPDTPHDQSSAEGADPCGSG